MKRGVLGQDCVESDNWKQASKPQNLGLTDGKQAVFCIFAWQKPLTGHLIFFNL